MKKFLEKTIMIFLLISPIIDMSTTLMMELEINMTIGIFIKTLIMFLACLYLVFFDKNKKQNFLILFILFILALFNAFNNYQIIKGEEIKYLSYLVKYYYYIIMLMYFIRYLKEKPIKIEKLRYPIVIIAISVLISNLTHTYIYSYDAMRAGNCAWYSSGNEFGGILSLFYPLTIFLFLDKKNARYIDILITIIIAFALANIGTKVGLLAFFITNIFYIGYRLLNIKNYKLNKAFYTVLFIFLTSIVLFNSLPTVINVKNKYDYFQSHQVIDPETNEIITYDSSKYENNIILKLLFSGRLDNLAEVEAQPRDLMDYLFGKVHISNNEIMLIESDLLDVFYMQGIVGLIIVYGFIFYLLGSNAIKYIKNFNKSFKYTKINLLILSILLTAMISVLVGHTLTCPSVSLYVAFVCAYLYTYKKFEKKEDERKKILIGSVHMQLGGIETVLVNLLEKIDYSKYSVDLLLLLKNGDNFKKINKNVNVITPYSNLFEKFYSKESKISKILKHLLFNRYMVFLYKNDKEYDVAIDFAGYYPFITEYIATSNADKKIIWVHNDMEVQYNQNKKYRKKINYHIKKYNKFDTIACVSKGTKEKLKKVIKNNNVKTIVVKNIVKINESKNKIEDLKGNYKIIAIGRLCYQKNFERLIEVHEKLIKSNYDVQTYIIGGGEDYEKLQNLINKKNISSSIHLLGQKNNIDQYLKQADLLVMTSRYEGWPTVLLEAMQSNVPWVGPSVVGIKDISEIAPRNSYILTKDNTNAVYKGVVEAIDGKVTKDFNFDIEEYNKKALEEFYKAIGD